MTTYRLQTKKAPPKRKPVPARITRVVLRNYRSIEAADVELGALTVLVGPNGAGKSNFLDALRFIGDALRSGLEHALAERGGVQDVRRRESSRFSIRLDIDLGDGKPGSYALSVGVRKPGGAFIKRERCSFGAHAFEVLNGKVVHFSGGTPPAVRRNSLFLPNASGFPGFETIQRALMGVAVYNLNPDEMRRPQKPDSSAVLHRDGRNIASIVRTMRASTLERIVEYLGAVVPGIEAVSHLPLGPLETLEFEQMRDSFDETFRAESMSDGTLRALGVLTAVLQPSPAIFVGIEEPELALHPAAADVLRECLVEASEKRQVAITTHSPELLDHEGWDPNSIIGVDASGGSTVVTHLDGAARSMLRDKLMTAGDLMRAGQLVPDRAGVPKPAQLRFFDDAGR